MADSRRRQPGSSRIASMLVAVGCLGVLGATYTVGFYAGRYWTRSTLLASPPAAASRPTPALTFYEELTAPLPPTASPGKPAEPRRALDQAPTPPPRQDGRARKDSHSGEAPARQAEPAAGPRSRFTVQIAAYSARASAVALRNTIQASGHEAYIVETDAPPGAPRYRVRVGSYPSREAAVAAAARLSVPGGRYVTAR